MVPMNASSNMCVPAPAARAVDVTASYLLARNVTQLPGNQLGMYQQTKNVSCYDDASNG